MENKFHCSMCGACCRNLHRFGNLYADLDQGNGVCRYYDQKSKLCSIYAIRPIKCRIVESYSQYASHFTWEEYFEMTQQGCKLLKQCN